ncbi:MAG: NAD(P)-dependent oxidoreductase [Geminicoccaceae bacterium]|nr:NAD(P)-dependent oxidoreductase [Geminicoccaceae bacterium]
MTDVLSPPHPTADRVIEPIAQLRHKRLLVTGAAGFIGGALMRRLAAAGCKVTGTVLYPHEAETLRREGHRAEVLDLASDEPFDRFVADTDIVFHIAAMFQETEHGEELYEKVNATGALRLCEAAARTGVERFVHCSTVGVHGNVKETPCRETSPYNPMDHYHRTKLQGERAILEFARTLPADGMVVTVNRPAMVYGPGDLRMLKFFRAILQRRFYMIGSGEVLAHLGYIDDQTESFLLSATAPREQVHLEAFNIASDEPITLNEMARTVADVGGVEIPRLHIPVLPVWLAGLICEMAWKPFGRRPPLFRRRVGFFTHNRAFDLTKARERLGYTSNWDHRRGIAETIAWYRAQGLV